MLVNVGVGYGGRQEIIDAVASYLSDSFSRGETPSQYCPAKQYGQAPS